MQKYKVRNDDGEVIGQYLTTIKPQKPDRYEGVWNVEKVDTLNDEPVNWFNS